MLGGAKGLKGLKNLKGLISLGIAALPTGGAIDVLVVAGQSNAAGQAEDAASLSWASDPNVMVWNGSAFVTYAPKTMGGIEWVAPAGNWSAEAEYARLYRAANPTKRLAIIKWTASGAQLFQSTDGTGTYDWNPASTGELFPQARSAVIAAMAALVSAGYSPTIRGEFWMQGETDASDATMGAAYEANLIAAIANKRAASPGGWGIPSGAPIIIGRVRANGMAQAAVRTAQQNVASADTGGQQVLMNTDDAGVNADTVHYNKAGLTTLGARLYSLIQSVVPAGDILGGAGSFAAAGAWKNLFGGASVTAGVLRLAAVGAFNWVGLDTPAVVPSVFYKITYTISGYSAGGVFARFGTAAGGPVSPDGAIRSANGTFTDMLLAPAGATQFTFQTSATTTLDIDNVTVTPL